MGPGHRRLLGALCSHGVDFVLIGGVGLRLHGYSAVTQDVDVMIATDAVNGDRVIAALASLSAREFLAGARGTAYQTSAGRLDVMRLTHGPGDFDAWHKAAVTVAIEPGLTMLVGSASDLILAKEAAGREKDLDARPRVRAELLANGALSPQDIRGPVAEITQPAPAAPTRAGMRLARTSLVDAVENNRVSCVAYLT